MDLLFDRFKIFIKGRFDSDPLRFFLVGDRRILIGFLAIFYSLDAIAIHNFLSGDNFHYLNSFCSSSLAIDSTPSMVTFESKSLIWVTSKPSYPHGLILLKGSRSMSTFKLMP